MDALEKKLLVQAWNYQKLYEISEKLHAFINVDKLINKMLTILHEDFSSYSYKLFLSNSTYQDTQHSIIKLDNTCDNRMAMQAYSSGEIQFEQSLTNKATILYIPLKGHKGVQGVLQIKTPHPPSREEIHFISLFAESAGSALENAYLYQSSQQQVFQLKLLHEAAQRLNISLELLVKTDHLTKLYSRKFLDNKVRQSMKEDEQGALILIDIDNFKEINDQFGHQVGDEVLIQVANVIRTSIREHDIGARWGGEELAIYLPMVTASDGAVVAKRIMKKLAEGSKPPITVSCGVSYWCKGCSDTYALLFKRADEALYKAKSAGKNRVIIQTNHIH
ncbi:sensor domain-containing diguanylate cyclase [Bacillus rubiinfantis]|uniref:sensor domain-containing diguanylate cyclase n=1 Tax=Bacillus rubiinfantis TaxID=1499680 RepID=UPI0005A931C7|nr:sensor domain-containing diguanylate cyclase [Bacillus rubiinfantis]